MLFNSYEFIFLFLPTVLAGFALLGRYANRDATIVWLVLASLFFYGWWNPVYLLLIVASIVFNFLLGRALTAALISSGQRRGKIVLAIGVAANLGLLGYFKYANFFASSAEALFGIDFGIGNIILPLAISFFTFQQIAYLVDVYQGTAREYDFFHYALFISFFPQLIAGPIVHHAEMMPQFMRNKTLGPRLRNFAIGGTIFAIGLFKKTILADNVAQYATPVFDAAYAGETLTMLEAWGGALAYTMQLYFDFSGYTDMAIGSARLFGIRLPMNFFSPYKATSIIEFWRRWHITLSRFLKDYLYIPLGGSRRGKARRYINLFVTMLLGGLWHGAGWTFVAWGALHGSYLVVNHTWHALRRQTGMADRPPSPTGRFFAWLTTFVAVVFGWVLFRAENFSAAIAMYDGMLGFNGLAVPQVIADNLGSAGNSALVLLGVSTYTGGGQIFVSTWLWCGALALIAFIAPNTHQLMRAFRPATLKFSGGSQFSVRPWPGLEARLRWRPTPAWAVFSSILLTCGWLALGQVSEFLYFQF